MHLNTGNYVTPELFSPPSTAYNTAQSTVAQFGSGMEPTITPGSEKSGVDSGYGNSQNSQLSGVPDSTPRSNGQQTEQGEERSTSTQLPLAKAKTAKTEQRKVLVFNTDTEDSDEQSSDDRKRSRKRASSRKRGKSEKVSKNPVD